MLHKLGAIAADCDEAYVLWQVAAQKMAAASNAVAVMNTIGTQTSQQRGLPTLSVY